MRLLRKRRLRGFSFMEMMITILIVAVVIGFVAQLTNEYAGIMRFTSKKDKTFMGAQMGVELVKIELSEAVEVVAPTSSATVPSFFLSFKKIDPGNSSRFPTPEPTTWNPCDPSHLVQVKYYTSGEILYRKALFYDGSYEIQGIAEGISGFSALHMGNNVIRISASFLEEKLVKTLTTQVRIRTDN